MGVSLASLGFELRPASAYEAVLRSPGGAVGSCRFRTPPGGGSDGADVVIGLLSCHNPFCSDGTYHPRSVRFLDALPDALEEAGVQQLLLMGDQMYTDQPTERSLFDDDYFATVGPPGRESLLACRRGEIRALMQRRYRVFWRHPAWRNLLARFPTSMICDDHEIIDNFGSAPAHAEARWQRVRDGALDAFYDMQGRGRFESRPDDFGHRFRWGRVSVLVPDLRTHRRCVSGELDILGPGEERLRSWLADTAGQAAVVVVLSVPFAHVPDVLVDVASLLDSDGGDVADRWSARAARPARDRLVAILGEHQRAHPTQRLVLAGGDLHVGALFRMAWSDPSLPDLFQMVSSAVSNEQGPLARFLARHPPRVAHAMGSGGELSVQLLDDLPAYGDLNAGVLRLRRDEPSDALRMELLGLVDDDVQTVLDSGWR